jgi:hypothetical protein
LAQGFSDILFLNYNNNLRYKSIEGKRECILKDIQPSSMEDIKIISVNLVKQFNQFHSEIDLLDLKSVEASIENEFLRISQLIS